jgi:hypothetical protein
MARFNKAGYVVQALLLVLISIMAFATRCGMMRFAALVRVPLHWAMCPSLYKPPRATHTTNNRLFSVVKYESVIHEFDPYFNYRVTQFLAAKGFYELWDWCGCCALRVPAFCCGFGFGGKRRRAAQGRELAVYAITGQTH